MGVTCSPTLPHISCSILLFTLPPCQLLPPEFREVPPATAAAFSGRIPPVSKNEPFVRVIVCA